MRSDLDRLMDEGDLEALWVSGSAGGNPALDYFVGRVHLDDVHLLKKRGEPALLLHGSMEREEAETTGLRTAVLSQARYIELVDQTGDELRARALQLADHIHALGISGRVAVYGQTDAGSFLGLYSNLRDLLPDITWVPDTGSGSVLAQSRMTKGVDEIDRIRRMGEITVEVVSEVRDFLSSKTAASDGLVDQDGAPVTVGAVKALIHRLLAERGAESPDGPIFAQGREAAMGHSLGRDEAQVQTGKTIVFDIFPRELGGGYYFDFTRTWCLDRVPTQVQEVFDDVKAVYDGVFPLLRAGASTRELQVETCRQFEARGHPTVLSDSDTRRGYIHGLAHGIGLDIHELPKFRHYSESDDFELQPGMIFTFEPGLYYPEKEIGVRLEDAVYVREDGSVERLVSYPHDLLVSL